MIIIYLYSLLILIMLFLDSFYNGKNNKLEMNNNLFKLLLSSIAALLFTLLCENIIITSIILSKLLIVVISILLVIIYVFLFKYIKKNILPTYILSKCHIFVLIPAYILIGILAVVIDFYSNNLSFSFIVLTFTNLAAYIYVGNANLRADHLTLAYNRHYLLEYVTKLNKNKTYYIMFIDINKLKEINDKFGHKEGDKAIIEISKIIGKSIRANDNFFRLGGDEFVAIIEDVKNHKIVEDILKDFKKNSKSDVLHNISFAIGGAYYNPITDDINEVIEQADKKMYKEKGLNIKAKKQS